LIPVAEARARILSGVATSAEEWMSLDRAGGRVLAQDVAARRTQPPADLSAMDGYAVRAADTESGNPLKLIGESAAGHGFHGAIAPGETIRIFTGAPLPEGADAILIQEDARADGETVHPTEAVTPGTYVRPKGLDFRAGQEGLKAGQHLSARHIGLLAAMDVPWVSVRRRPRIALLSSGDELVRPGEPLGPDQIISSNALSVAEIVRTTGGEPVDLGIAPDEPGALIRAAQQAAGCDLLVTLGGASMGDHDLVQGIMADDGNALDFWKIAMRPGKPLMFGRFQDLPMLGLPGNPVSSMVCAVIFLRPAIRQMLGLAEPVEPPHQGILGRDLSANDRREDYLRSKLEIDGNGRTVLTPYPRQDSSMISVMSQAGGLAIRPANAPAAHAGDPISYVPLQGIA